MNNKPIDKSKKANRRCCNCRHWHEDASPSNKSVCVFPTYNEEIAIPKNYWNCCKNFEWRGDKEYIGE